MYSRERFTSVKNALVTSLLTDELEAEFLSNLLSNLAAYGKIDQKAIDSAIDAVWEAIECIPDDDKDDTLANLYKIGEYYAGELSERQKRELSILCRKCKEYLESPNAELFEEIEEML